MKLDITRSEDAFLAVQNTLNHFGKIDVLVNIAANFYAGFFEELSAEQMNQQLFTSLLGPMNVARAVLPTMRNQKSGLIITISSTAGLIGFGQQSGDPAKLAKALIDLSAKDKPSYRFIAGANAIETAEKVATTLQQQLNAFRELSSSLAF